MLAPKLEGVQVFQNGKERYGGLKTSPDRYIICTRRETIFSSRAASCSRCCTMFDLRSRQSACHNRGGLDGECEKKVFRSACGFSIGWSYNCLRNSTRKPKPKNERRVVWLTLLLSDSGYALALCMYVRVHVIHHGVPTCQIHCAKYEMNLTNRNAEFSIISSFLLTTPTPVCISRSHRLAPDSTPASSLSHLHLLRIASRQKCASPARNLQHFQLPIVSAVWADPLAARGIIACKFSTCSGIWCELVLDQDGAAVWQTRSHVPHLALSFAKAALGQAARSV